MAKPRVLMLAPVYPPGLVGGFPIILRDIAAQLAAWEWQVVPAEGWEYLPLQTRATAGQRWETLLKTWVEWTPSPVRYLTSRLALPSSYYRLAAHNLRAAEAQIRAEDFDVLMLHVDGVPPGLCALAADLTAKQAKPLVLVSMAGLAEELRGLGWGVSRQIARALLGREFPSKLSEPIRPRDIQQAVFASSGWRTQAIQAGLSEERSRVSYFGVRLPQHTPRPCDPGRRILWVGRLSREKGLHLLLRALPDLLRRLPDATVTVIAAEGPSSYRELIEKLMVRLGLGSVVKVLPPVPRAKLTDAYLTHDVLFFHSAFNEPVALVLMEAYAAGLPVVSSAAAGSALVRNGETCVTYDPRRPDSIVSALHELLTNVRLREQVTVNAERLVRSEFSLEAMGRSFDDVLCSALRNNQPSS